MSFRVKKPSELHPYPPAANNLTSEQQSKLGPIEQSITVATSPNSEKIGKGASSITFGLFQPAEVGTGTDAPSINLCVGPSYGISEKAPEDENGVVQSANPNPNLDAASILVAAEGNVAAALGMPTDEKATSAAIGMKATNIAFAARNGIRFATKTDRFNEYGEKQISFSGIEIAAGNDEKDLQAMVKGDDLVKALKSLAKELENVIATSKIFRKEVSDAFAVLAGHTHPDILNMIISAVAAAVDEDPTKILKKVTGGSTLKSIPVMKQCQLSNKFLNEVVERNLTSAQANLNNLSRQYFAEEGTNSITSRVNKVT